MDPDFVVVARVEALIAGWDMDEALRRAEAYYRAGADAVLVHSRRTDPADIEGFMKVWKDQVTNANFLSSQIDFNNRIIPYQRNWSTANYFRDQW